MKKSFYISTLSLIFTISLIGCTNSVNTERLKTIDCSTSTSDYDNGKRVGEIMATASDGERDCKYGYETWSVKESQQMGFPLPEYSDCYCKGFYEGYDKTKK